MFLHFVTEHNKGDVVGFGFGEQSLQFNPEIFEESSEAHVGVSNDDSSSNRGGNAS